MIATINLEDVRNVRMMLEDEDIIDKLNAINNTHYQINRPLNEEDLLKLVENVKAYNYDKPTMVRLKNGRWIML